MEPIGESERIVVNWHDADFEPFENADLASSGESILQLDRAEQLGVGFHLYKMEPGAASTPHEHTCNEQFLVLTGELIDHDGYVYRPGDLVLLKEGTIHNSRTESGCVLAVFIATPEVAIDQD